MSPVLAAAATTVAAGTIRHVGAGETVVFWVLAPVALLCAVCVVASRHAVHAALFLVVDFFCLAVFYVAQDAPFLGLVQVIVYTGAIMVLFLFVLMLVGVDSSDSLVETLRGQRAAAVALGVGFAGALVFPIGHALSGTRAVGLRGVNAAQGDNVHGVARLLFTTYIVPFELTSALLIVAAVGAMVLGHREHVVRRNQREMSRARFEGKHPTPLPGPGVFALHDSVATGAVLPSGEVTRDSLPEEFSDVVTDPRTGDRLDDEPEGPQPDSGRTAQPVSAGSAPEGRS